MRKTRIKAYHQVGGDDRTPAERKAFMDQILDLGRIVPAIERIQRREMYNECFTEEAQGSQDIASFTAASEESRQALAEMAREKIALLPVEGSTHTMFNCMDLIAGDFERIFLSVADWYNYANGFVFDAEGLLMGGASYRPRDLLGFYRFKVEQAAAFTYDSVEDARREFEQIIEDVRENNEFTGKEAVTLLRVDCARGGCPGEIVWPGSLPLGLAIEMWREGRRTKLQEGVRR
jgi:hypothetical protein